MKADIINVLNEREFRARTGDTLGYVLSQGSQVSDLGEGSDSGRRRIR